MPALDVKRKAAAAKKALRFDPPPPDVHGDAVRAAPRGEPSYSVAQLCELEQVCKAWMYAQWKQGKGPRFYLVGNRRRITAQAREDWHRQLEGAAEQELANSKTVAARRKGGFAMRQRRAMAARDGGKMHSRAREEV